MEPDTDTLTLLLEQAKLRYLREPRLARRADGTVELHVLSWRGADEAHLAIEVTLDPLALGAEREIARGEALMLLVHAPTPSHLGPATPPTFTEVAD